MKKRFLISLLILVSLFTLTGCGTKKANSSDDVKDERDIEDNYIHRSQVRAYASNLVKIIDAVSEAVNSGNFTFTTKEYLVVPIVCVELERGNNEKSPFSKYLPLQSYVVVTKNGNGYNGFDYRITALDETGYGVELAKYEDIVIVEGVNPVAITKTKTGYSIILDNMGDDMTAKISLPGGKSCIEKLDAWFYK